MLLRLIFAISLLRRCYFCRRKAALSSGIPRLALETVIALPVFTGEIATSNSVFDRAAGLGLMLAVAEFISAQELFDSMLVEILQQLMHK